jgi:hypothetical protein
MGASSSEQNKDRKQENFYCSTNNMILGGLLFLVFALIVIFIFMNCNKMDLTKAATTATESATATGAKYLLTSTPGF